MCGIVGVVLKYKRGFDKQTEDSFFEMLYADALRGFDSTGVIAIERDSRFHIAKEATEATYVAPLVKAGSIGKSMWQDGKAYIGHNRKSTVGKTTDVNAHPFVIDKTFAMVHNGTLYNHEKLAKTDVDSEALGIVLKRALEKENYKEALEEELGHVYGAYAVAMYDQKRHKLFLLRNKERPLQLVEANDAYYFASEGLMAGWILARNGYQYKDLKVINIEPDTLITFDLDSEKMTQEVLVPKKSTPHTTTMTKYGAASQKNTAGELTKKNFKKLRSQYLGKRISFWADDFVENNYPKTVGEDGETSIRIWGQHDDIDVAHSVEADVDIGPFRFNGDETEIIDRMWSGVVEAMEHSPSTGLVFITVTGAKPLIRAVDVDTKQKEPVQQQYIEFTRMIEGMSDGYLVNYLVHKKADLKSWQVAAINQELNARHLTDTYHENSTTVH